MHFKVLLIGLKNNMIDQFYVRTGIKEEINMIEQFYVRTGIKEEMMSVV